MTLHSVGRPVFVFSFFPLLLCLVCTSQGSILLCPRPLAHCLQIPPLLIRAHHRCKLCRPPLVCVPLHPYGNLFGHILILSDVVLTSCRAMPARSLLRYVVPASFGMHVCPF